MARIDRRTAWAVALAVAAFAVIALAAAGGTVHVWHEPPPSGDVGGGGDLDTIAAQNVTPGTLPPVDHDTIDDGWVFAAGLVLIGSILLVVIYSLITTLARRLPKRATRSRGPARRIVALPEVDVPTVELDEAAQLAALQRGDPRNAIVACWLKMEDDVAAAGLPKHVAETSAEYTTRVLAASSLDPAAVRDLAALYREARFSRHALGQPERERALLALRQVHASMSWHRPQGDVGALMTAPPQALDDAGSAGTVDR
jgi:Domain of unknown function (DUF4129)